MPTIILTSFPSVRPYYLPSDLSDLCHSVALLRLLLDARLGGRAVLGIDIHCPQRPVFLESIRDPLWHHPRGHSEFLDDREYAQ